MASTLEHLTWIQNRQNADSEMNSISPGIVGNTLCCTSKQSMNNESSLQTAQTSNYFPPVSSSEYNLIHTQAVCICSSEGAIIAVLSVMLIKNVQTSLSEHFYGKTML